MPNALGNYAGQAQDRYYTGRPWAGSLGEAVHYLRRQHLRDNHVTLGFEPPTVLVNERSLTEEAGGTSWPDPMGFPHDAGFVLQGPPDPFPENTALLTLTSASLELERRRDPLTTGRFLVSWS
jgi:hypothetical protein